MSDLIKRVLANQAERLKRLALQPRCPYRHVYEENGQTVAGDPCGGKLKPKKFRREVVALECVKCGRQIPVKRTEERAA